MSLLLFAVLTSCEEKTPFPGYKPTGTGLYYKEIVKNEAGEVIGYETQVIAVGSLAASHRRGELAFLDTLLMGLWSLVAQPADFELEALVAQVASYGSGEDQFLFARDATTAEGLVIFRALQGCEGAVLAVAEDDELDAVEAQLLFTNEGAGIVDAAIVEVVEILNDLCAAQGLGECRAVEGPRVDVGVDAEVGGGTIEERLAALPCRTGGDERGADTVDVALAECSRTELRLGLDQLVEERRGL